MLFHRLNADLKCVLKQKQQIQISPKVGIFILKYTLLNAH